MRVSFRSIGIAAAAAVLCMALTGLGHAEPALISAVKQVDAVDAARNTTLIYAAHDGHGEIARLLRQAARS